MSRQRQDKRRYHRRAKSIRFRFEHGGDLHFAVSTSVSLSGAFLKAARIPPAGTVLVLDERFNPDGITISLRGEVVWTLPEPSLERPDTGFGFRFQEAFTRADPGMLEDFLRALDPAFGAATGGEIAYEERANGVHAVFRFPVADDVAGAEAADGPLEPEEPHVIDLARELERLSREEARRGRDSDPGDARQSTGVRAPASPRDGRAVAPPGLTKDAPPAPPPEARARTRKRSVTGIFTALFGRGGRDEQPIAAEPTPALGLANPVGFVEDTAQPRLLVSWGGRSVVARVESLGRKAATLWTSDAGPASGEAIVLRPAGGPSGVAELLIHAVVKTREDRGNNTLAWLAVDFKKVDEHGRAGRFQDYLRLVNGPGGDER